MADWVEVCVIEDIPPAGLVKTAGGVEVLLVVWDGRPYALSNTCSHQDMPLAGGRVERGRWVCPHHGARFDIATGRNTSLPAASPVGVYETKLEGGKVFVRMEKA